jgi:hypothetical protein
MPKAERGILDDCSIILSLIYTQKAKKWAVLEHTKMNISYIM